MRMAAVDGPSKGTLPFGDLPLETQKQIVGHLGMKDLVTLQTVSHHLHGLASAEIYRTLDFNIISAENEDSGNPMSRAADALQTILASEYDYGQYIKSFRIGAVASDTRPPLDRRQNQVFHDQLLMTRLLWDSKTDPSKFLSMAVLLMARKASVLESFEWDAPIELSSAVYQALQKIPSLRHLLVRLDTQPSPRIGIRNQHTPMHAVPHHHHHHPPPPGLPPPGTFVPHIPSLPPLIPGPNANPTKRRKYGGSRFWEKRHAFSGFRYLSNLELVGISNYEMLSEVAQCIKLSSSTLKSLTLTLSYETARKSRKPATTAPPPIINDDLSESDLDDEDDLIDPPLPPPSTAQPVTNEADIREERLAQENILATVFDLQSVAQVGKKLEKKLSLSGGKCLEDDENQILQEKLSSFVKSLQDPTPDGFSDANYRRDQLKHIKNMIDSYLKLHHSRPKKPASAPANKNAGVVTKSKNPFADKVKELHKSLTTSSSKPAGGFGQGFNSLLENFNGSLPGDETSPWGSGSASGKSSSYGFPNHLPGASSSSGTTLPPPPLPNSSSGKYGVQALVTPEVAQSLGVYTSHLPPSQYVYAHSHPSSSSHTPTMSSSMYHQYSSNGYSAAPYSPPDTWHHAPNPKKGASLTKPAKAKGKKISPKKKEPIKHFFAPSSDESDAAAQDNNPKLVTEEISMGDSNPVESMNVDLEHPDEDLSDPGEDQEIVPEVENIEVPTPRKRFKPRDSEPSSPTEENGLESPAGAQTPDESHPEKTLSATEAMQDYIRATYGLHLEELRLHLIPLKASIVGRALDLAVLRRITLLDVGPQDTFWALLVRLMNPDYRICFKSIHTDHVSVAFTKYLASFEGLEELFIHQRHVKEDPDSETTVDITRLRKAALSSHISTLKRLMIRNDKDDSWDVDAKTLQFIARNGHSLVELSCSMRLQTYHVLIQMFAAFTNLHALHVLTLRSFDRNYVWQSETLNFAIDSLSHCPNIKLRYLALGEHVTSLQTLPANFPKHMKIPKEKTSKIDKKGKGKAVDVVANGDSVEDNSDRELGDILALISAGENRLRLTQRFDDVRDVKIFKKEIRTGRL